MNAAKRSTSIQLQYTELSLDDLGDYPALAASCDLWAQAAETDIPYRLDFTKLSADRLDYTMLLEMTQKPMVLRVRLSGSALHDENGYDLSSRMTGDLIGHDLGFFLLRAALDAQADRAPSLARCLYPRRDGNMIGFVRLLLPLRCRRTGRLDRFLKVIEPTSLVTLSADHLRPTRQGA